MDGMHDPTYEDLLDAADRGLVVLAVHDGRFLLGGLVLSPNAAVRHPRQAVRARQHVLAVKQAHARNGASWT